MAVTNGIALKALRFILGKGVGQAVVFLGKWGPIAVTLAELQI